MQFSIAYRYLPSYIYTHIQRRPLKFKPEGTALPLIHAFTFIDSLCENKHKKRVTLQERKLVIINATHVHF